VTPAARSGYNAAMTVSHVRASKFLSRVLRHQARAYGLQPDEAGFVPLAELAAVVARAHWAAPEAAEALIRAVVAASQPQRYEIQGDRIRATYGHSTRGMPAVRYPPAEPPAQLFHGTTPAALPAIRRHGLRAMRRQYVHLSTTPERALTVGGRRAAAPVLLTVQAQAAHAAGVIFYAPEPQHFLAAALPPEFLLFPEAPADPPTALE